MQQLHTSVGEREATVQRVHPPAQPARVVRFERGRGAVVRSSYDYRTAADSPGSLAAGQYKVERWLRKPTDVMLFGNRLALGWLLSVPQLASRLQDVVDRAQLLVNDPRPLNEKQVEALQVLDERVAELLERGWHVEKELLALVAARLPPSTIQQLPPEFQELLQREPQHAAVLMEEPADTAYFDAAPVNHVDLAASQKAGEVSELRDSVAGLRSAVEVMAANSDPAQSNMLQMNLKEAVALVTRRLDEVEPLGRNSQEPSLQAAVSEATLLLSEVNTVPALR